MSENRWDAESRSYSIMTLMEVNGTNKQLDAMPLDEADIVLDCGCGPGRIAIQVAKRVKKVICLDSSEGMLNECRKNCADAGIENVEFILADWQTAKIGETVPEVDVVIQSRGGGGATPLEKMQQAARKYAINIMWAKGAANLPESRQKLFVGCYSEQDLEKHPELGRWEKKRPSQGSEKPNRMPGGPSIWETIKENSLEAQVTTVEECWEKQFQSKQEAYDWLIQLSRYPELVNMEQFQKNVDHYLTQDADGWYFALPTASDVTCFQTR